MKKLLAIATLLLATTAAAQAQYTFEYGGRTIRVDPDRGTVQIPGVYDNTPRKAKRARTDESEPKRKQAPQQAKTDNNSDPQAAPAAPAPTTATAPAVVPAPTAATTPPAAPAPAEQTAIPAAPPPPAPPPAAAATTAPEPATTTAAVAPSDTAAAAPPPLSAPPAPQETAPVAKPAPAATVAVAPPSLPPAPKAAVASNSPVGVWLTEQKEGKVRIEQCGTNLCGYAVDKKSNANGEQILINMKPGKDNKDKWSGRIFDPNSGSTYDSTIALKNTDTLRVQGCAFGGMFCGGQTWTRVN